MKAISPVVPGLVSREIVLAKDRPPYLPLPAVPDPVWKVGEYVRFARIPPGGPVYRVEATGAGGMIEIEGMSGEFAPSIFVAAEEIRGGA
jgi:hypothetical protein